MSKTIDQSFGNVIHQLRTSQLCALNVQLLILVLEYEIVSIFHLIVLPAIIFFNMYLVGRRWYNRVDGRPIAAQIFVTSDILARVLRALGIFNSVFLAVLTCCLSPRLSVGMRSFGFEVANHVLLCTSFVCACLECFEGIKLIDPSFPASLISQFMRPV